MPSTFQCNAWVPIRDYHDWTVWPKRIDRMRSWQTELIDKALEERWETLGQTVHVLDDTHESIELRFRKLASKWTTQTAHVSSVEDLVSHPNYQEIIKLGWEVVPFLLTDLTQGQGFWFPALAAITSIRPFDPGDAGNGRRMAAAWIAWGKRKGLL